MYYYQSKGIRILDSNYFVDEGEQNYLVKYTAILTKILDFSSGNGPQHDIEILNHLFNLAQGVRNLKYLRRDDFNNIFSYSSILDDNYRIQHLEKNIYLHVYISRAHTLQGINDNMYSEVNTFFDKCFVTREGKNSTSPTLEIENLFFSSNYSEMIEFCQQEYTDPYANFVKAYYCAKVGDIPKSYDLFTDVLKVSQEENIWDIFYLSQVNRKHIFQMTKCSSFQLFKDNYYEFFERIELEMEYHNSKLQFDTLPCDFQSNYSFLSQFATENCFVNDSARLLQEKYKVEKSFQGETTYFGISEFDKIKLNLTESYKFVQDNYILVDVFDETKNYVKNALFLWLRAYKKDKNKKKTGTPFSFSNTRYRFTVQDVILLSKNCSVDDLRYFDATHSFLDIPFEDEKELILHCNKMMDFYESKFSNTEIPLNTTLLYYNVCEELQSLFYVSSYFLSNIDCIKRIVFFLCNNHIFLCMTREKIRIINLYVNDETYLELIPILEKWLLDSYEKYKVQSNPHFLDEIAQISSLLSTVSCYFAVSLETIDKKIQSLEITEQLVLQKFVEISNALSDQAKELVIATYVVSDVWKLIEIFKFDQSYNTEKNYVLITDYLDIQVNQIISNKEKRMMQVTYPPQTDNIHKILMFMVEYNIEIDLTKYESYWSELDFLYLIENFDVNTFDIDWLLLYPDKVLHLITEDNRKLKIVKENLGKLKESAFEENTARWLYLLRYFIN